VQKQALKEKHARGSRNHHLQKAGGTTHEKFTDRVLQKLQMGAKVQGTFAIHETKPPLIGST